MAERQSERPVETLHGLVDRLEEGDEFEIYAWECLVEQVIECEARPMLRVRKKSVGGYMERTYRLEWADPADEGDETLAMKADRKHGWDVRFECNASDVQLEDDPVGTEASTDSGPAVMTDGGVDQSADEVNRAERAEELAVEIQNLMYTEQENPYDEFSDLLDNAQATLMTAAQLERDA